MTPLRLLIADDDPNDAKLVVRAVKRAGYAVEWQRVDDEAGFARELPGVDLVICDFQMPRFSPMRALEMIRESGLDTPLVLVSGGLSAENANRILMLGAVGYLSKDQLDGLGQVARAVLAATGTDSSG
jgi:CheY-like chemotaxis protein